VASGQTPAKLFSLSSRLNSAIVTGSLTMLSLLVLGIVVLWVGATLRHASHHGHTGHHPVAT